MVPSLFPETFGYVVLEAFAVGTPVIVHEGGGALYETGFLSGGGLGYRTDGELLLAMRRMIHDHALHDELARRGFAMRMGEWSESAHMDRYFELIEQAASARADAGLSAPARSRAPGTETATSHRLIGFWPATAVLAQSHIEFPSHQRGANHLAVPAVGNGGSLARGRPRRAGRGAASPVSSPIPRHSLSTASGPASITPTPASRDPSATMRRLCSCRIICRSAGGSPGSVTCRCGMRAGLAGGRWWATRREECSTRRCGWSGGRAHGGARMVDRGPSRLGRSRRVRALPVVSALGRWAATVAAGTFQASPLLLAHTFEGHYPHVWAVCWYPWAFWAYRELRTGRKAGLVSLPLILALTFLTGHPQEWLLLIVALSGWVALMRCSAGRTQGNGMRGRAGGEAVIAPNFIAGCDPPPHLCPPHP